MGWEATLAADADGELLGLIQTLGATRVLALVRQGLEAGSDVGRPSDPVLEALTRIPVPLLVFTSGDLRPLGEALSAAMMQQLQVYLPAPGPRL